MRYVSRTVLTLLAATFFVEVAHADETKSLEQLEYEYRVRLFEPTPVSPAIREALRISEENRMQRELLELSDSMSLDGVSADPADPAELPAEITNNTQMEEPTND